MNNANTPIDMAAMMYAAASYIALTFSIIALA